MKNVTLFLIVCLIAGLNLRAQDNTISSTTESVKEDIVINNSMIEKFNNYKGDIVSWNTIIASNDFTGVKNYMLAYRNVDISEKDGNAINEAIRLEAERIKSESDNYFLDLPSNRLLVSANETPNNQ